MKTQDKKEAVIYARVSHAKQKIKGGGLDSQETRCREFATYKGYEVVAVFKDDMSGGIAARPGMSAMLAFLNKHRKKEPVVIIDDISRLARGLEAHLALRTSISSAGGTLESPSIEFGEDSDSQLIENMLASVAQHHRQKNAEQTKNRMRARMMSGYWVFQAPVGYRYERHPIHKNWLVPHEPVAALVREAIEGFASGRFDTQAEVMRFLQDQPDFPRPKDGIVQNERVFVLLRQKVYAGYVDNPEWGVSLRKGQHEPLVSWETFSKVQERLTRGSAKAPIRKDMSEDFPLRGFVTCCACDKPLTASWSTGKSGRKHPYYSCFNRECGSYRKSIKREAIEGDFEALLETMQPRADVFEVVRSVFQNLWEQRGSYAQARTAKLKGEIAGIENQIEGLLDRIVEAQNASVISAYERRISNLEAEKLLLDERLSGAISPRTPFRMKFEHALNFLKSPVSLWFSESIEDKRRLLRMAFAGRISYCREGGFRTPKIAFPFKALEAFQNGKLVMARPERFERPTLRFVERSCGFS
ncbi:MULTISPECIES: recombinase family protein [Alphaproteobacteria]|uniref:recombinase family protein n=1 Tax=Alphaproteobacteria TaxID=28211 RepID=UPI003297887A